MLYFQTVAEDDVISAAVRRLRRQGTPFIVCPYEYAGRGFSRLLSRDPAGVEGEHSVGARAASVIAQTMARAPGVRSGCKWEDEADRLTWAGRSAG